MHLPLNIDAEPFSLKELQLAQKRITIIEGKAHGDDSISSEVMKRVDIDVLS